VNNERRSSIDRCATEAVREISEALRLAHTDTPLGDETAKERLALAAMALDRFRRVLEAPVLATKRPSIAPQPALPVSS